MAEVALVPPIGIVTVISTVPALPAGAVAVIDVPLFTVNVVAALAPNFTAVAPVKFVPVIATMVPPAVGPLVGLTKVTVGGATTVKVAEAVVPVPPFVELTCPVVLFTVPAVASVTLTVIAQELFAATVPLVKLIELAPAVVEKVPPHVLLAFGVLATCRPDPVGNVSLTASPVSATVLAAGFVIVRVSAEVPFTAMLVGENDLLMLGGDMTVILAEAVPPVPPSVELIAVVVLFFTPAVVPVTFTEMAHEPPAAIVPPVRLMVLEFAVAERVPLQVLLALGVLATVKPVGILSVNATPLKLCVVFGLVIVNVRLVLPFSGIVEAPNDLLIVGGATTVTLSLHELFASLLSATLLLGSTAQVPLGRGLANIPAALGVAVTCTVKVPVVAPIVTVCPEAMQVRVLLVMPQLMFWLLVMFVGLTTLGVP